MTIPDLHWASMLSALVWAVIGLAIFALGWMFFDRVTPYSLWKEIIDEHNTALAIVVGAVAISLAMIVSSAIR
jgi:putative membrane protein